MSDQDRPTYLVEVEPAAELEWRSNHGVACCCMSCVLARGDRRAAAAKAIADRRKAG